MDYSHSPLVLGSTGGLGTNSVLEICQLCGFYMVGKKNKSNDAIDFIPFYKKWFAIQQSHSPTQITNFQKQKMFLDFQDCVQRHRDNIPDQRMHWGWKNKRSIYFLPYFHSLFPSMKFIHIVRDGRDIAFSTIQKQLLNQTKAFVDTKWNNVPIPFILMYIWEKTNYTIANYGEERMKNNYMRIRFEDLCENPYGIIKALLKFLNISQDNITHLAETVKKPSTIGKWHMYPVDCITELEEIGKQSLLKFGYI